MGFFKLVFFDILKKNKKNCFFKFEIIFFVVDKMGGTYLIVQNVLQIRKNIQCQGKKQITKILLHRT